MSARRLVQELSTIVIAAWSIIVVWLFCFVQDFGSLSLRGVQRGVGVHERTYDVVSLVHFPVSALSAICNSVCICYLKYIYLISFLSLE
jgi:hypothetical protein